MAQTGETTATGSWLPGYSPAVILINRQDRESALPLKKFGKCLFLSYLHGKRMNHGGHYTLR